MLLEALRFVQGAVAKKDHAPALTHLAIEQGRVKSYNGRIALSCPIPCDFDVRPKANLFIKAIATCRAEVALHMTTAGRLAVRSGKFRAHIECDEGPYPDVFPDGKMIEAPSNLVSILKRLAPFISEDASRVWSRGIMFKGQSAYATNNVVAVQCDLDDTFPIEVNLPEAAVLEAIRIGEQPKYLLMADNHLTFFYEGDKWMRAQLCKEPSPDIGYVIAKAYDTDHKGLYNVDEELGVLLDDVAPQLGVLGAVYLRDGRLHTAPDDESGASVAVEHTEVGVFSHEHLKLVSTVAATINFSAYPRPVLFVGRGIRGVIMGMRI